MPSYIATTEVSAELRVSVMGSSVDITLGTDPDHGICAIDIDGVAWGNRDTYAATAGKEYPFSCGLY